VFDVCLCVCLSVCVCVCVCLCLCVCLYLCLSRVSHLFFLVSSSFSLHLSLLLERLPPAGLRRVIPKSRDISFARHTIPKGQMLRIGDGTAAVAVVVVVVVVLGMGVLLSSYSPYEIEKS